MKLVRVFSAALMIAVLVLLMFLVPAPLFYKADEIKDSESKCVLTLWHIETFEGGSGSRAQYLESVAAELEKTERNLFVWVRTMNVETLNQQLKEGRLPDLVSFGQGIGNTLKPFLIKQLSCYGIREEFYQDGLALAYMTGGYALIGDGEYLKQAGVSEDSPLTENLNVSVTVHGKEITPVIMGETAYTSPKRAVSGAVGMPQYSAYESFILKKSVMLIGSTRDLHRIMLRESVGKGRPLRYEYLPYTDLVQYIGVITTDGVKARAAAAYLNKIYSAYGQNRLIGTGLMSVTGTRLYSSGILKDMEDALSGSITVEKLFA